MTTRNGQPLTCDALRRLVTWASDIMSAPASSASYAYDGEGERVQRILTSGSTTTTTQRLGSYQSFSRIAIPPPYPSPIPLK
jgi:YD repeat-containing protein